MTDLNTGLTSKQVEELAARGLLNGNNDVPTKSIGQIFRTNILTFFNALNVILAVAVLCVGQFKNALFVGVILCNTAIGIFQEIRAKRTIDKLTLISAPKAHVLRDGRETEISVSQLALGDITLLAAGRQICADSVITQGDCEVNESLITGEPDAIYKKVGDRVLSGSFVVCGEAKAEVEKIGSDNFASKITGGAKYLKKNSSKMLRSVNAIIKAVAIIIIPIAIVLFTKALYTTDSNLTLAVTQTVASLIGMIPEGLVLLTSIVLAVAVIRLSAHNTLVQDMYCTETLARVDVLCLDKTGTITEGRMQVDEVVRLDESFDCDEALTALMCALSDKNPTFNAIKERYNGKTTLKTEKALPFSSAKKWSGAQFGGRGSYIMGAAEFILTGEQLNPLREQIERYSKLGQRVILLAHSALPFSERDLPADVTPKALVLISDVIRKEAPETLKFFAGQGVDLKIISGDNPVTVAAIARRAGLAGADRYVDATTITDIEQAARDYSVFGRVTPDQKLALVKALKKQGHTVAMTGDGVNDVLALKEADCSVAMQSGSDAARSVSSLVLLDSNFASMPKVVAEGRRSINNVERSAMLFLTKTVYSFLLAVAFMLIPTVYPIQPIQMTLVNAVCVGIPSFLLSLEPNFGLIRGSFIKNIMYNAIPQGVTMAAALITAVLLCGTFIPAESAELFTRQAGTVCMFVLGIVSEIILIRVCTPFNWKKALLCVAMLCGFFGGVFLFPTLFDLTPFTQPMLVITLAVSAGAAVLLFLLPLLTNPIINRIGKRKDNR